MGLLYHQDAGEGRDRPASGFYDVLMVDLLRLSTMS
jgi:hypothetical protein